MLLKIKCNNSGVTLIELIIASLLLSVVVYGAFSMLSTFRGKMSENLSKRLILQMEARKALTDLYRSVQDGLEVISPPPGVTLSHLAYRDVINNIRVVYLEEDKKLTDKEGMKIYKAMMAIKDPTTMGNKDPKCIMRHVTKINFTTYGQGAVLIDVKLHSGSSNYSIINFVRLQNTAASYN